ncbi:MAG: thioredoxin-dependent thiol peroxidase [Bdellovibrionota bacterium]|nr:MAG: thioredoxin-dependent thiol peroxidase [Bdellovibrionota bacterium]
MAKVRIGDAAPDFCLSDWRGRSYSLHQYRGTPVVIYFYPKDNTPGCTIEAQEFTAVARAFARLGVKVLGISGGDERSKRRFCEAHGISIPLLSDTDHAVSKAYGAFGPKTFMGRKYRGIHRTTFVIDSAGRVQHVYNAVQAKGHAREVLELTRSLLKDKSAKGPLKGHHPTSLTGACDTRPKRRGRSGRIQAGRGLCT